jgi:hypothetical protein
MPISPCDAEISAMLDMLAGDSSDSVPAETMAVATIPELEKTVDTQRPEGTRPKRLRQVSHPTAPAEGKKKKKRQLRRVSCLDQDVGPSAPAAEEVPVELFTGADPNGCDPADVDPNGCDPARADPNGCDPARADPNGCDPAITDPNGRDPASFIVRIVDEDEEEEEVPLIRKNSWHYRVSGGSSDIPSPALFALVGLQELSIANFDKALEDVVPEDLLSEPTDGDMMDVCSDIPDVGLEVSWAASRASSTLEGGLWSQEVGQGRSIPMEVTENPSALEVAVAENLVLKGGAGSCPALEGVVGNDPARVGSASCNPAPEGVRAGSPSHTSMDVQAGSSPPHSGGIIAAHASNEGVALKVDASDAGVLMPTSGVELIPSDVLQIAPVDIPSSSHHLASRDLGFPSFFYNLQVIWLFLFWQYSWQITVFVLICF